jgi:hypothetical protein
MAVSYHVVPSDQLPTEVAEVGFAGDWCQLHCCVCGADFFVGWEHGVSRKLHERTLALIQGDPPMCSECRRPASDQHEVPVYKL